MQFLLMDYVQVSGFTELTAEEQARWLGAYRSYMDAMLHAGILKGSNGLEPSSTARTVRIRNNKTQVMDGPFAESKEQLGGYHLIDVANIDAAVAWAAKSPTALHGSVEVRPIRSVMNA